MAARSSYLITEKAAIGFMRAAMVDSGGVAIGARSCNEMDGGPISDNEGRAPRLGRSLGDGLHQRVDRAARLKLNWQRGNLESARGARARSLPYRARPKPPIESWL
jgi:hypothetical protein